MCIEHASGLQSFFDFQVTLTLTPEASPQYLVPREPSGVSSIVTLKVSREMGWAVWKQTKRKLIQLSLKKLLCLKHKRIHSKHEQCIRFCVTFSCEAFMHFKRKGPSLLFIR